MKYLRSYGDYREIGVKHLTGEACNLGMRVLCDLTEQGRDTVCELLGLNRDQLPEAVNGGDGVASLMIPRDLFESIGILGLLRDGAEVVYIPPSTEGRNYRIDFSLAGIYPDDTQESRHHETVNDIVEEFKRRYDGGRVVTYNNRHPHVGSNNCRAF
jgi:hypothetical protein